MNQRWYRILPIVHTIAILVLTDSVIESNDIKSSDEKRYDTFSFSIYFSFSSLLLHDSEKERKALNSSAVIGCDELKFSTFILSSFNMRELIDVSIFTIELASNE